MTCVVLELVPVRREINLRHTQKTTITSVVFPSINLAACSQGFPLFYFATGWSNGMRATRLLQSCVKYYVPLFDC